MFSSISKLMLVTAIVGVTAFLSPVAHATITITRQEVQWSDAVVLGKGATANAIINWRDNVEDVDAVAVTTANKRGKFSFKGAVPSDCEGILSTNADSTPILVSLDNCTPDSGDPGDPGDPGDSGGPGDIPKLPEPKTQPDAHQGDAVRAVGFATDEDGDGETWVISGGEDAYLRTWDLQNLYLTEGDDRKLDHPIYDLETSTDGSIVVSGEGDWNGGPGSDTFRIWLVDELLDEDLNVENAYIGTTAPIGFVYCVAISPSDPDNSVLDSAWTVASGFYGEIVVYDTSSSLDEPLATKKTKKKRTKALAFSPDGSILASTSTAGRIQLWRFPKDKCDSESCELVLLPVSLSHGGSWVFPIAFAPYSTSDEVDIVSGSDGGMIKVWTIDVTESPDVVSSLPVPSGAVYALDWWSPPGDDSISMIVAGGNGDITVYVYDGASMDILYQTMNAHVGRVNDVAFSPDGSMIASGGADGALKLWALPAQ